MNDNTVALIINGLNRIEGRVEGIDKKLQSQNVVIMRHTLALERGTEEFESLHHAHEEIRDEINFVRKFRTFVLFFRPTKKKIIFLLSFATGVTTLILKYDAIIKVFL